jgi:hypothetical protein
MHRDGTAVFAYGEPPCFYSRSQAGTRCELYVAMTRAKRELILSFHDAISPWIKAVTGTIGTDLWSEVESLDPSLLQGTPEILSEFEPAHDIEDISKLTGIQFIYTAQALGLSIAAQDMMESRLTKLYC